MDLGVFLPLTVNGILLGGFYALMAVGFSLSWRVVRVINLAHGEFLLAGAYIAWTYFNPAQTLEHVPIMLLIAIGLALAGGLIFNQFLFSRFKLPAYLKRAGSYSLSTIITLAGYALWMAVDFQPIDPFIAFPIIALLFFATGYTLQKLIFNRIVTRTYTAMLVITLAIKIILENLGLWIYTADLRTLEPTYAGLYWRIGQSNITLSHARLFVFLLAMLIVIALAFILNYTHTGQAIRAAAQHRVAARLVGIDLQHIYAITFGIALALTGMAGALLAAFQPITPEAGSAWTLRALAIVVLSGAGNIQGAVLGGIILGLSESYIGGMINTGWATTIAFIILVVMLIWRSVTRRLQPGES